MKDACYRKIQMLRLLNTRLGTAEIKEKLQEQGFEVDVRTIQRDLNSLSKLFEIERYNDGWRWKKDAEHLQLPEIEPAVALSFKMVKTFLSKSLAPSTIRGLQPYFKTSEDILNNLSHNHFSNWDSKIALLSRNQPLLSPQVKPDVLSNVYDGLLLGKQINAVYQTRKDKESEYIISPRAIVVVDQITYLLGTLWEYQEIRQFALHRFQSAEVNYKENHRLDYDFDLKGYINNGNFEYTFNEQDSIKLKIKISKGIAKHLSESKLSEDQTISETPDGFILNATTKNTKQLRWWLLGFGDGVQVLQPRALREEFKKITEQMYFKYNL